MLFRSQLCMRNIWVDDDEVIFFDRKFFILHKKMCIRDRYTDVNGVINIGIVNDWLYIENSYGNNKISNMDKIFDEMCIRDRSKVG